MLLLNEDQYHLFDFLPKPVILKNSKIQLNYVNEKDAIHRAHSLLEIVNNDIFSKIKTLQKALNNVMKKGNEMSIIDKKLIDSLDIDLVNLLKERNSKISSNMKRKTPDYFKKPE